MTSVSRWGLLSGTIIASSHWTECRCHTSFLRANLMRRMCIRAKKEAQPKSSHRNAGKAWFHPTKRTGGPGMNLFLLWPLFAFWINHHSSHINVSCSQPLLKFGFIWMRFMAGFGSGYSPMLWQRISVSGSLSGTFNASYVQHAQRIDFPSIQKIWDPGNTRIHVSVWLLACRGEWHRTGFSQW